MDNLDAVLIRAYICLNSSQPCSTEDITCDPVYRRRYLDLVRQEIPSLPEDKVLRRLSSLREPLHYFPVLGDVPVKPTPVCES